MELPLHYHKLPCVLCISHNIHTYPPKTELLMVVFFGTSWGAITSLGLTGSAAGILTKSSWEFVWEHRPSTRSPPPIIVGRRLTSFFPHCNNRHNQRISRNRELRRKIYNCVYNSARVTHSVYFLYNLNDIITREITFYIYSDINLFEALIVWHPFAFPKSHSLPFRNISVLKDWRFSFT